jgi:hypothetical protein
VGTAIGELEVFQEQAQRLKLPPMEEICQFCQAVKRKDETANICCRSGKVALARVQTAVCRPTVVIKVRSYNSIFTFTSIGALLAENALINE